MNGKAYMKRELSERSWSYHIIIYFLLLLNTFISYFYL